MKQAGFTLVELLIALVIVAIISVMAAMGLHQLINIDTKLRKVNQNVKQLNLTMWRFEHDITQLQMRRVLDNSGDPEAFITINNNDLRFTTAVMPANLAQNGATDFSRVEYKLVGNQLERITYPVVDRVAATKHYTEILLNNVNSVYWKFLDSQHQWQSSWAVSGVGAKRPLAVQMNINLSNGMNIQRYILLTTPLLAKGGKSAS